MPCTHAARPNARHRSTRKLANRSPIRRSTIAGYGAETAPVVVPEVVSAGVVAVVGVAGVVAVGVVVVEMAVGVVVVVGVIVSATGGVVVVKVGVVVTVAGSVVVVVVAVDPAAAGVPALISPDSRRLAAIAASFGLAFR